MPSLPITPKYDPGPEIGISTPTRTTLSCACTANGAAVSTVLNASATTDIDACFTEPPPWWACRRANVHKGKRFRQATFARRPYRGDVAPPQCPSAQGSVRERSSHLVPRRPMRHLRGRTAWLEVAKIGTWITSRGTDRDRSRLRFSPLLRDLSGAYRQPRTC